MKYLKLLPVFLIISTLIITGCKKDIQPVTDVTTKSKTSVQKKSTLSGAALRERLAAIRASLPAGFEKRLTGNVTLLSKLNPEFSDIANRPKIITPTACNDNTPLNQWLNGELADWDSNIYFLALITGMLDFPTYDALLFENSSANQYFGLNSAQTKPLIKTFKDLQRFWNIQSSGIVLAAMHGNMLLNREKVIRIDMIIYGDDRLTAEFWADLILQLLDEVPQYRNGDHPIFTFNAFAQTSFFFPPVGIVPDKIIMGDGIMQAYKAIGFDDVAPQAIVAHEFGHHVQFQIGVYGNDFGPEATRRTELMADAYSAYYLSHARGATMQWKRVKQFLQVFYNIGDCAFTSPGHHGTPTQRMAAAEWAYNLANDAQKQGHIITSQEFAALFEAQLPTIILQ